MSTIGDILEAATFSTLSRKKERENLPMLRFRWVANNIEGRLK
jgi:hypothetical protein